MNSLHTFDVQLLIIGKITKNEKLCVGCMGRIGIVTYKRARALSGR